MKPVIPFLISLVLVGCGSDKAASEPDPSGNGVRVTASAARGTRVVLGTSEFGRMLFDSKKQAIYIFQRDRKNKSNCHGACAKAWPPVFTKARPRAGKGVHSSLLGTIRRKGGARQVTYAGKPLYYYAHEGRGEVKCHNVNLNGGFWWAVGADGDRLQ
jgi:predicted lipoprotein with Yx(FWY)xxD motif